MNFRHARMGCKAVFFFLISAAGMAEEPYPIRPTVEPLPTPPPPPVIYQEVDPYSLRTPPPSPVLPAPPHGRYAMNGHVRAGHPHAVSPLAKPSIRPGYSAGWVGGSTVFWGEPRYIYKEGVWGLDYHGRLLPRRIWLAWTHGRRYQGGTGAYETEGPPKLMHYLESRHAAHQEHAGESAH